MIEPQLHRGDAVDEAVDATRGEKTAARAGRTPRKPKSVPFDLERYRAETERVRVLAEFLGRPVHAHGGTEPDPDIVTAYNLAVEAALKGIRRAASQGPEVG